MILSAGPEILTSASVLTEIRLSVISLLSNPTASARITLFNVNVLAPAPTSNLDSMSRLRITTSSAEIINL